VGWRAPQLGSPAGRLLGVSFWEVLVYLLNAVLFVLVGLQLHPILSELSGSSVAVLVGQAALVSAVVIATRLVWGFTVPYLIRALDRRPAQRARRASVRERLVAGWSGMRGAVSLAAALALPLTTSTGQPFPHRHLIVFRRRLKARGGYLDDDGSEDRSLAYQRLVRELLEAQRREIVLLRNQGQISNQVMGRIEHDLDLEDARLEI
jgi:Sodium/hydrogen exchanger family